MATHAVSPPLFKKDSGMQLAESLPSASSGKKQVGTYKPIQPQNGAEDRKKGRQEVRPPSGGCGKGAVQGRKEEEE